MKKCALLIFFITILMTPVITDATELIDTPTAEIIDYYSTQLNFRFYSNGGVVSRIGFGVFKRLNIGFSFDTDKVIGIQPPEIRMPALNVKFRLYDGSQQIPAIAVGYDGQGYNYDNSSSTYYNKEKGIFCVFSMETMAKGLEFHMGFNTNFIKENNNKDIPKSHAFIGLNYTIEDNENKLLSILTEYDNLLETAKENRFNAGLRIYPAPNLNIDIGVKDISSPKNSSSERILRINYQGKF